MVRNVFSSIRSVDRYMSTNPEHVLSSETFIVIFVAVKGLVFYFLAGLTTVVLTEWRFYMKEEHEIKKDKVKIYLFVGAMLILLYWGLNHLNMISQIFSGLINIIMPFIIGGAIAFVFNVPMRSIEKHMFTKDKYKTPRIIFLKRVISYVITLLGISAIITMALLVVIPELISTISDIVRKVPGAIDSVIAWANSMVAEYPQISDYISSLTIDWEALTKSAINFVSNQSMGIITGSIGAVSGIFSWFATVFIAFVFSIYILFQKEKLIRQAKKIVYALLPNNRAQQIIRVVKLCNTAFSNFISGQCLEAVILGLMFFIAMSLFRMPYALLIGVVIAVMALIPIVGAFIGCGVGVLLIAMVDPVQALIFLVMFLVLQQIEGNLIYPYVVGNSVGLPGMWVLVAVTVGGSLFGVAGMLTFIPICSVLYVLLREYINSRLKAKNIDTMEELYGLDDIVESAEKRQSSGKKIPKKSKK